MWGVCDRNGPYADCSPCPTGTGVPETMAFPADPRRNAVKGRIEDGVRHGDATGGKAVREPGYEPVEEDRLWAASPAGGCACRRKCMAGCHAARAHASTGPRPNAPGADRA